MRTFLTAGAFFILFFVNAVTIGGATGDTDKLWLRYEPVKPFFTVNKYQSYKKFFSHNLYCATGDRNSPLYSACKELSNGLSLLFEQNVSISSNKLASSIFVASVDEYSLLNISTRVSDESFTIQYDINDNKLYIISDTGRGTLYGVFHFLNLLQRNAAELPGKISSINITKEPKSKVRIWQLWDNMDGTVERGYGGRSIFHWEELPNKVRPRYDDYARYLASVGINSISLSNVNSCYKMNQQLLNSTNIEKAAVLGKIFQRYGIATFLVPCFDSPMLVDKLNTSDPFDPHVVSWWKSIVLKLRLAFRSVGNKNQNGGFIGFLFKADSEGMPGKYLRFLFYSPDQFQSFL